MDLLRLDFFVFIICERSEKTSNTYFCGFFLFLLSAIPDEAGHGWYRYPFYPFLISATALFLREYFTKNFITTFFFIVFIGTSLLQLTWASVFGFSYHFFRLIIASWLLALLPYFIENKKIVKIGKASSYLWLVAFLFMNIWAVLLYTEQ